MPYRKQQFINNEIYHIVLRGVDDNLIFKNTDDYYRSIFSIYEFNHIGPIEIRRRRQIRAQLKRAGGGLSSATDSRKRLVEILAFCFMPNHIHLLLRQLKEGGITNFMRKVGTGYAGYFNRKYKRRGHLFQNKFASVYIKDDEQLKTALVYIHTNPISLVEPKWKEMGIKEPEKIIGFLENYKWASYPDYVGKNYFPSVTERNFIFEIMGGGQGCRNFVENWVRYKGEIQQFPKLTLE